MHFSVASCQYASQCYGCICVTDDILLKRQIIHLLSLENNTTPLSESAAFAFFFAAVTKNRCEVNILCCKLGWNNDVLMLNNLPFLVGASFVSAFTASGSMKKNDFKNYFGERKKIHQYCIGFHHNFPYGVL